MTRIQVEVADVVAAQWLHMRPGLMRLLAYAAMFIAAVVGSGWMYGWQLEVTATFAVVLAAAVAMALGFLHGVHLPLIGRRMHRQNKLLREPAELEWDERAITLRTAAAHSTLPWEDYVKWKENDRLFLLYVADRLFQIIPKRTFASAADMQDFRRHLPRVGASLRSR